MSGVGRGGIPSKKSLLARADMDRLGINPIEMLKEVFEQAMNSFKEAIPLEKGGDPGVGYLGIAGKAAADLASYRYPKLSAVAYKDLDKGDGETIPLSTSQAIKIIQSDPFAPSASDVVEGMNSAIQVPALPKGDGQ